VTWRLGFADLESGERPGGGAGDCGDELVAVVNAPGAIGLLDVEGPAGVADAEVDALPGHGKGATAADPALDADRFGRGLGCRSGGSGVTHQAEYDTGDAGGHAGGAGQFGSRRAGSRPALDPFAS
jgi:hypothetical protein